MKTRLTFALSLVWLLAFSILVVIYGMWLGYGWEIQFLDLEQQTHLTAQTISYNFQVLIDYLTLPWVSQLSMPDFRSSEAGLHHFQAVKSLFHLVQALSLLLLPAVVSFYRQVIQKDYFHLFSGKILAALAAPIMIGSFALLMGFENFFILFHQLLFVGDDSWLFDPRLDPVIRILPESFFLHAFVLFFLVYEGILLILWLWSRKSERSSHGNQS